MSVSSILNEMERLIKELKRFSEGTDEEQEKLFLLQEQLDDVKLNVPREKKDKKDYSDYSKYVMT